MTYIWSVIKNLLFIGLLFALAYWFYMLRGTANVDTENQRPEEYMNQIEIITLGEDGNPLRSIKADRWQFLAEDGYSEISDPLVTLYRANGELWNIMSGKAVAWHKSLGEKITHLDLQQGVELRRKEGSFGLPITVVTEAAKYFPESDLVTSDDLVQFTRPGLMISGYGMVGHLDKNLVELKERVTTVYDAKYDVKE